MNSAILTKECQQFIDNHLHNDVTKLILKGSPFKEVSIQELANQIIAKKKSEKKLPSWFALKDCYFPDKISIEQTSSETTAAYKASLVSGKNIIDISGGFGVDTFYFSRQFQEVFHCEINEDLSQIVAHNFSLLDVRNVQYIAGDGIEFLKKTTLFFDVIFIDPSRRNDQKEKVFLLKDCSPNIPKNVSLLFNKTNHVLVKTSPILDITSAIKELQFVKEIHVVAIQNEVKELLFLLEKNYEKSINIQTVNILKESKQEFQFQLNQQTFSKYSPPLTYLFEPNAAILKSGGFEEVANQLGIYKLHKHTHLYTSDTLIDFPGRSFKVEDVINYDKRKLKKIIPTNKANITTRNFPKRVAHIRKETNLKDGGDYYLFFITDLDENFKILITKKV